MPAIIAWLLGAPLVVVIIIALLFQTGATANPKNKRLGQRCPSLFILVSRSGSEPETY